jgi:hypothetical protein
MDIDMINEIKAAMAELEFSGILERTGETRWAERSSSGSLFTLCRNLDAHCPPPGSVSTIIKTGPVDQPRNETIWRRDRQLASHWVLREFTQRGSAKTY